MVDDDKTMSDAVDYGDWNRKDLNLEASLGDAVLKILVEGQRKLSMLELAQSNAEQAQLSVADAYQMTKAAVNDLGYLGLVTVDRASATVELTPLFNAEYR